MNSDNKLPIADIFNEALLFPFNNLQPLLRVGAPLIVLSLAYWLIGAIVDFDLSNSDTHTALRILTVVLYIVATLSAVVGCHRILILGAYEDSEPGYFLWTGNEIRYAGWWVVMLFFASVIAMLITITMSMVAIPTMETGGIEDDLFASIILLSYIPAYYVMARVSLLLPSVAVGHQGRSLAWAWGVTDGHGWRLTFLIFIIPFAVNTALEKIFGTDYDIGNLIVTILWLVVGAIEVALLSLSYQFLVGEESKDNDTDPRER